MGIEGSVLSQAEARSELDALKPCGDRDWRQKWETRELDGERISRGRELGGAEAGVATCGREWLAPRFCWDHFEGGKQGKGVVLKEYVQLHEGDKVPPSEGPASGDSISPE